jgi:CDGSH-type Zn-finger protein
MAEDKTEERLGRLRTSVELEPGENVAFCRCSGSKEFPSCDGTHKSCQHSVGLAIVKVAEAKSE